MSEFKIDWPTRGHGYIENDFTILKKILLVNKSPLSQGPNVEDFELKFSSKFGLKNSKAVMSTTTCASTC